MRGRGVFGLDGVEDASEETLRYDSCSGAYIKLGVASVWGCFNVIFNYKVPCNESRRFVTFSANKLRNYFPHISNKLQHTISHYKFVADLFFFTFHILSEPHHHQPRFPLTPNLPLLLVQKT